MSKSFEPRVSKRKLRKVSLGEGLEDLIKANDEKLLRGAQLSNVRLSEITVKKQVRTKFNDDSIAELAQNIKENGLIQPLVIHRDGNKFVLICGERRYRAMSTIEEMVEAPCFILENKTIEELMAIQFSENSSREDLHYIDQADSIANYKKVTGASERKIQAALGISKSEVHRCIMIAKLRRDIKEAAKAFNTEKYVLLEWDALENCPAKNILRKRICNGTITKRLQLKRAITQLGATTKKGKTTTRATQKKAVSANVFIKAMNSKAKDMDPEMKKMLQSILNETKEMVDL